MVAEVSDPGSKVEGVRLKDIPNMAWATLIVIIVGLLGVWATLLITHTDTMDFYRFLNVGWTIVQSLGISSTAVYAGVAARASKQAAKQTNGDLDARIATAVEAAFERRGM